MKHSKHKELDLKNKTEANCEEDKKAKNDCKERETMGFVVNLLREKINEGFTIVIGDNKYNINRPGDKEKLEKELDKGI